MDLQTLQIDRKGSGRRRPRRNPWPFRLVLLAVLAGGIWLFLPTLSAFSDRLRLPQVQTFEVRAPTPATAAAVRGTAANGYVIAARRAALSSDVPGRIVEMLVEEGSQVKKGDIVARLYSDEYRAALDRAQAELQVAKGAVSRAIHARYGALARHEQRLEDTSALTARLDEAEAQRQFAADNFARIEQLVRQHIGSQSDLDLAKSELAAAEARLRSAEASLRGASAAAQTAATEVLVATEDLGLANAQVQVATAISKQAQATLDKTNVRAPFDGIVVLKDAEVGEVVSPNVAGGSEARGAVCTMVDWASLEVQANVPESSLSAVRVGGPVDVFLDAFPDQKLRGRVDRIWPTADRQKATVEVRVELIDRIEQLRPEMGVRIVFRADEAEPATEATSDKALLVPEETLVEANGRTGVFVIERDTVRFVDLQITDRRAGRVAITDGLRPGQRLVFDPPDTLQDGDRIRRLDG